MWNKILSNPAPNYKKEIVVMNIMEQDKEKAEKLRDNIEEIVGTVYQNVQFIKINKDGRMFSATKRTAPVYCIVADGINLEDESDIKKTIKDLQINYGAKKIIFIIKNMDITPSFSLFINNIQNNKTKSSIINIKYNNKIAEELSDLIKIQLFSGILKNSKTIEESDINKLKAFIPALDHIKLYTLSDAVTFLNLMRQFSISSAAIPFKVNQQPQPVYPLRTAFRAITHTFRFVFSHKSDKHKESLFSAFAKSVLGENKGLTHTTYIKQFDNTVSELVNNEEVKNYLYQLLQESQKRADIIRENYKKRRMNKQANNYKTIMEIGV